PPADLALRGTDRDPRTDGGEATLGGPAVAGVERRRARLPPVNDRTGVERSASRSAPRPHLRRECGEACSGLDRVLSRADLSRAGRGAAQVDHRGARRPRHLAPPGPTTGAHRTVTLTSMCDGGSGP